MVLSNATLVDPAVRGVRRGHIEVHDGRIVGIHQEPPTGEHQFIDLTGRLLMPGNVCAHTHLYSALARGMPPPPRTPRNFVEILELVWWRLDRALDASSIRSSALVGALDAVRAGTTALVDHHASPSCIDGSLDIIADALDEVGARAVLCYEVTDRNGAEGKRAGLRESERFLGARPRRRIRGMVGAHASFTLEDDTLAELAALAEATETGVHMHVAEDIADEEDSLRRSGRRAAVRLASFGLLRDQSIAAHGVHLDQEELQTIHRSGSWLVHNCRSNLNNSVGRAPVSQFGPRAALGTDGIDGDMFAESRTAFFRGREASLDAAAETFIDMLSAGGRLLSSAFGEQVGELADGARADLLVLDYDPPTPLNAGNFAWHWMFAFSAAQVESVMIDGQWVMREGTFPHLDEEAIRAHAREDALRLWRRMEEL